MLARVLKLATRNSKPVLRRSFCVEGEPRFLEMVGEYFDKAITHTDIQPDMAEVLKLANTTIKFHIPLIKDDGSIEVIACYRCQHKHHLMPTKGGTRMAENVHIQEVEALASLMSIKLSLADIPFGGAKGGLRLDPRNYSKEEIARLIRRYTIELSKKGFIGAGIDVPGPDVGVGSWHMDLMKDTYETLYGQNDINAVGCVTGKSVEIGGINGREESTGLGVYFTVRNILNDDEFAEVREKIGTTKGVKGKTYTLQGFGNVGSWFAKFMNDNGAICVGIAEYDGSIYDSKGIDIEEVKAYIASHSGSVKGFPSEKAFADESAIYEKCDIFVPAALEQAIHVFNADKFQCKIISEAANGATTVRGDEILQNKGILVVPDILANGAGVTCSYFEWLKNLDHRRPGRLTKKWEEQSKIDLLVGVQKVLNKSGIAVDLSAVEKYALRGADDIDIVYTGLDNIMTESLLECAQTAEAKGISWRMAAYVNGIERIYSHYEKQGFTI